MLELQVASFLGNLPPAIRFKDADNLSTFHVYKYTPKVFPSTASRQRDYDFRPLCLPCMASGFRFLHGLGVTLIAADSPDAFLDDTPTAVLIRQILGPCHSLRKPPWSPS
jgi:hypothetical protein